jgi:hypothetical protein
MKLVPFFLQESIKNTFRVHILYLFLGYAGKSVWTTEDQDFLSAQTILQDYCEPNGIFVKNIQIEKDIAYIQVNNTQTNIADFYSWEEAVNKSEKPECWRRFYFLEDAQGGDWWSPKGLVEAEIQGLGNIEEVYRHLRRIYNI